MKNKKLNILFVSSWYPNKINPTNGNFIQKQAWAIAPFCNVFVLHVCSVEDLNKIETETTETNGVLETIVYFPKVMCKIPVVKQALRFKENRKAHFIGYELIASKVKIDVCHCNIAYPSGLFALALKRKYNIKYIISEHWTVYLSDEKENFTFLEKRLVKKTLNGAAKITVVSKILKESISLFSDNKNIDIIPNVINTELFIPKSKKIEIKRFIHISNLNNEQKNFKGIISAVAQLSKSRTDFSFDVISDGDIKPYINLAKEQGILNSVLFFHSTKSEEEIAAFIQQSDIYVCFSNFETFGVVLVEALACGLTIISTEVGIASEIFSFEKKHLKVPIGNELELEKSMLKSFDVSPVDKDKAHQFAAQNYASKVIGAQFYELYKSLD